MSYMKFIAPVNIGGFLYPMRGWSKYNCEKIHSSPIVRNIGGT